VTFVRVTDIRKAMAIVSNDFFGKPQESLILTAITGTNGKTTTSYIVRSIFESAGLGCGLIGTIKHIIGDEVVESLNTTPEAVHIHSLMKKMVGKGQKACVMEVSSHALALDRVYGIKFRAAAFLNLTRDHLDFHGEEDKYMEAKGTLFRELPFSSTSVINIDDPHSEYFIEQAKHANLLTFGWNEQADIHPLEAELGPNGTKVNFSSPKGKFQCTIPIPGRYNVSNAMAGAGIALSCGLPISAIMIGIENLPQVRGRFESVREGQDFSVIIDYAHTPDALERILSSAREITDGRLISVFGCGGDRDRGKRPVMGEISTSTADLTIITSDNPRTENPVSIIDEIISGISETKASYEVIPDRARAIEFALKMARPGDTVVIAGKGHEDYQIIGREKRHFDDSEVVRTVLRSMK
jgi:UDP-N-acetylmuramoyl-L-alanyl-D-glutamate--2,6-diaminopimelate ligase